VHRAALTGQQFQSADVEPVYVLFEDFTHVKFYRRSFDDAGLQDRPLGQCAAGQRRVELPLSPTDAVPLGLAVASEEHLLHRIAKRRRHAPDQVGYTRS
jgi:hypothetical protein